jgi:hypothetical protein
VYNVRNLQTWTIKSAQTEQNEVSNLLDVVSEPPHRTESMLCSDTPNTTGRLEVERDEVEIETVAAPLRMP